MKIAIARKGEKDVITIKEYTDISGKGEIAHFLVELEIIKLDLLGLWEEYTQYEN